MKRLLIIFIFLLSLTESFAQTLDWLVKPQYSEIKYFGPEMYKVTKDGKVGLISTDGVTIVPAIYDAISLFFEGRAIFVNKSSNGWKLMGVVTDNGDVKYTHGDYYLINDYKFFSEGFITVRDANGKNGYLNEDCQPAFEFTNNVVRPFSEGYAAVGKEDDFHWIDTEGESIWLKLKNGGTPYGGTNFYDGKAYLWDEDGVIFELGADGVSRKVKKTDHFDIDYLYRVGSDQGSKEKYTTYEQTFSNQWLPDTKNGKWTFLSDNGEPLSAYEYDKVWKFSNGSAVASLNGHYGLLQISAGHYVVPKEVSRPSSNNHSPEKKLIVNKEIATKKDPVFFTQNNKSSQIFSVGTTCSCGFKLFVPEAWRNKSISVLLIDTDNGRQVAIQDRGDNSYSFSYKPNSSNMKESKTFRIEVRDNGTLLWQGKENYTFVQRAKLSCSIRVNNADANSNDRCLVTAIVKNTSPIDVTTTVTLSGGGSKASFNNLTKTIKVPAHSSRSVTSSFVVYKVELNGWCSVATSDGGSSKKLSNIELKPF